ncbi:alpha/beta hydrolase [Methylonatrum kenyense]|uniref:alpha/beta hydrolase n=1 Tax=Methylonatrum kenyense TaxID=455253 RepID=UPI0020BE6A98|nr:alpha/beta hydrolase [Methylonatrum kenyense]MCK8515507.1 alpha/beta hydrolase [Methylonatrum kenyense]
MPRMLKILLLGLALAYLVPLVLLYLFQDRLAHLPGVPGRELTATPERIGLDYEDVTLETPDGLRLHGWFLPHEKPRGTLLFLHGNAGNISHRLDSLEIFHELGLEVLIIDYRGYGQSEGRPSEPGLQQDARVALDYLLEERGRGADEIAVFGRSLGGALAAGVAAEEALAGVIVESAFTSAPDLAAELYPIYPVRWLARLEYDTRAALAESRTPVLVIHSPEDEIIPFAHGERLYQAAPEPKSFLELRGDHNTGFLRNRERYMDGLDAFLREHLGR